MKPAINISNYEEFFLLYTDGELSAAEKQAVEQFVQENPQLAMELDMLQQMKLPADDLLFTGKDTLYKNEGEGIRLENYETHFLSYVDNELGDKDKAAVETFVLQHPSLQDEFMLLKKTRLQPETIVFPDKASLYRKEEKERRIVYMRWQRIAVAAVLTGVIALVWTLVPSDNTVTDQPVIAQQTGTGKATAPQTIIAQPTAGDPAGQQKQTTSGIRVPVIGNTGNVLPIQVPQTNTTSTPVPANETVAVTTIVNEPDRTVTTGNQSSQTIATPVTTAAASAANNGQAELPEQGQVITPRAKENLAIQTNTDNTAVIAQPAVYKELDTEDDKKSLYVGSLEINKDKLRGFFRKATSLFRGKAKHEEEERVENAPSSSNTRSLK